MKKFIIPLKLLWHRIPVSDVYGLDRGQTVDRIYIENFLEKHKSDVKGRCLEILNTEYIQRFGGKKVTIADALDINEKNLDATIYGDLRNLHNIKSGTFDCIILTQTLQYIDDVWAAVRECHRILKKNGVILVTVPCLSRADVASGVDGDFWRFMGPGARYLFAKVFGDKNVEVETFGNTLTALEYWVGLAQEDVSLKPYKYDNPNFPMTVTVRAVKK